MNQPNHPGCVVGSTRGPPAAEEPLPLGRTDDLLQYTEEIWQDLDDASSRVAALHRAEDWEGCWNWMNSDID